MELSKKTLYIITNYEYMLRQTIDWFNETYETDFEFAEYVHDEVSKAIVHYSSAIETDVFHLGQAFGRKCEAFDKAISSSLPPGYFDNEELYPRFE